MKSHEKSLSHLIRCVCPSQTLTRRLAWTLPLLLLSACAVSEVSPEVGATTGGGETSPEMAVRLPAIRLANRPAVDIGELTSEKADRTVAVSGRVTQRSALLEGWLYQVQDSSGSVWILTEKEAPAVNESVTVEGTVRYEPVVVGEIDASGIYLEERSHREADE